MSEVVQAIKMPWKKVSECISLEVSQILGRKLVCKTSIDDHDYWAAQILGERIPLSELFKVMETVNASEDARNESLPESAKKESSAREFGLSVSELLLSRHLGLTWTAFYLDEQHLWLPETKEVVQNET